MGRDLYQFQFLTLDTAVFFSTAGSRKISPAALQLKLNRDGQPERNPRRGKDCEIFRNTFGGGLHCKTQSFSTEALGRVVSRAGGDCLFVRAHVWDEQSLSLPAPSFLLV